MRFFIVTLAFVLLPVHIQAAILSIDAPTTVTAGDIVTARVAVNTNGVAINNAEATLRYPSDLLSVISVSKSGSIFSLWVEEPAFSNAQGSVRFNGGLPTPGFTGASGSIVTITLQAKKAGVATLALSDAAVRANDGYGTNVISSSGQAQITVRDAVAPPAAQSESSLQPVSRATGSTLALRSPSHPDERMWYSDTAPRVVWSLPSGATAVQTGIGASPDAAPTVTYAPAIEEKKLGELENGTWYFKMRYRTASGWSPVSFFQLNIDTTPPEIRSEEFVYSAPDRALIVRADTSDAAAGISHIEMLIDGVSYPIETTDVSTAYEIAFDSPGAHTAQLIVYDRAGNRSSADASFIVPTSFENQPFLSWGGMTVTLVQAFLAMFVLVLLSLGIAAASWYRLWRIRHLERIPLRRVRKDIHHGFELYKSDLADHVHLLDTARRKRELTKEEASLYKRLTANLTDLETFLNKELDRLE